MNWRDSFPYLAILLDEAYFVTLIFFQERTEGNECVNALAYQFSLGSHWVRSFYECNCYCVTQ